MKIELLEEVEDWEAFLLEGMSEEEVALIDKHTGTGRLLGEASFVEKIGKKIDHKLCVCEYRKGHTPNCQLRA